jgi:wyosine [tRNA(Phe)-imidazoG37] synthetase (radical SAM superfamily)
MNRSRRTPIWTACRQSISARCLFCWKPCWIGVPTIANERLEHNKFIPHEELMAEFGLTMDDFERMGRTPLPPKPNGTDR